MNLTYDMILSGFSLWELHVVEVLIHCFIIYLHYLLSLSISSKGVHNFMQILRLCRCAETHPLTGSLNLILN
jgi:hypothetical protein